MLRYTIAMIEKKQCNNKECGKLFYGTKRAKFCSDKCRVTNWRKNMFNVDMSRLKQAIKNRSLEYKKNDDGTVTINEETFDREYDVEVYLMTIPRTDGFEA